MSASKPTAPNANAIAREAIRTLASRQLPATPANYERVYRQIASGGSEQPTAAEVVERLVQHLPDPQVSSRAAAAVRDDDWEAVESLLAAQIATTAPVSRNGGAEAASLVGRLIHQLETHHAGITLSKKRDGLKRALIPRNEGFTDFHQRLTRLIDSWSATGGDSGLVASNVGAAALEEGEAAPTGAAMPVVSSAPAAPEMPASLSATNILGGLVALASDERRSKRQPLDTSATPIVRLRTLIKLILENIAELTPESEKLQAQIEQLERVLTDPLTEQKLDEAERVLRSLIIRQGTIKHGIEEAKSAAKELASSLIERLTNLSASAGTYTDKLADVTEKIARAENLTQLSHLVMTLLSDTQLVSSDLLRARDDLDAARAHARDLEGRTRILETELAQASALVRTDPLTAALNRRGFEDVYAAVVARPGARQTAVALLDVDDFKKINDSFGHLAGDDALKFLTEVLRDMTRPTDAIGRYGGEEFVVLFPDTPVERAAEAMTRIQRELTKRVFLQDHSRILITFSCGVTQIGENEGLEQALLRADNALLEAKRKGKNKVVPV